MGSNPNLKLKPEVEMLKKCLEECSEEPENSIMIGDSDNDIIPANKLSMRSIFVTYGYGKAGGAINPSFTIDRFNDLTKIINN